MATRTTPIAAPDRPGQDDALAGLSFPLGYPSAYVLGDTIALAIFIPAKVFKMRGGEDFDVPAKERPQARVIPGKKPFAQFYTPPKTAAWEKHVGEQALRELRAVEIEGDKDFTLPIKDRRLLVNLRFNLRRPVSVPKSTKHAVKKPDVDNLAKAILDALVSHKVIEDDNAITDLLVIKRYATEEHPMGVEVDLTGTPL